MNRTRLLMLCLVAVGGGAAAVRANVPVRPGWTLTWQDEFDVGTDLTTAREMWNTGEVFN